MTPEQFDDFIDPGTGRALRLADAVLDGGHVRAGRLVDDAGAASFEVRDFVPRFVPASNYAANFGLQWRRHARTQLDSHTGTTYSRDRFFAQTGWPTDMTGQRVLEAGSGAGRFTEVVLATGATLCSFDFSDAVDANYASNGAHPGLRLFQGDVYRIPLRPMSFDRVFCMGVLQHTPDVARSFRALAAMVRPGGQLAVDVYSSKLAHVLHWKYALRPLTTRMDPRTLYDVVRWYAPRLMPVARVMRKLAGRAGHRLVPILDQSDKAVSPELQREWTVLDTYDALSAAYDRPQSARTLRRWFDACGFVDVRVGFKGVHGLGGVGTAPPGGYQMPGDPRVGGGGGAAAGGTGA